MLTGKWPHQNGQVGLSHLGFQMKPGQVTLPALLRDAGYRTGIIGKRHVEPVADVPFDWEEVAETAFNRTRNVQWVAERSRDFFASAREAGRPFFYYVNYYDPHGPLNDSTDVVNGLPNPKLTAADIREHLPSTAKTLEGKKAESARLYNTVLRLDAGVGLLLAELKAAGFADNTLVIFAGDNGVAVPGGKMTSSELGLRVPLLVRWPGKAKPGQVRDELVSLLDVMPTVLDATGVRQPAGLAGLPLQPLLRGEKPAWRELLFSEMNFHTPDYLRLQRTVRDSRHKLLLNLNPREGEPRIGLYDLRDDPWEKRNLANEPALKEVREKLEKALAQWRTDTSDPTLDPARVERWQAAAKKWSTGPRLKRADKMVVAIPKGELKLLD
jgi:N-sulfoglucosamine sulfohydrolase